jgi:hypothetical protein
VWRHPEPSDSKMVMSPVGLGNKLCAGEGQKQPSSQYI